MFFKNTRKLSFALSAVTALAGASLAFAPPALAVTTTPIATIQGTNRIAPSLGTSYTTRGFVTAAYPTGGFNGFYIQTAGTGGVIDFATHKASDGIFVYGSDSVKTVSVGDYVEVTGKVAEYNGLTQLTFPTVKKVDPKTETPVAIPPVPAKVSYPKNNDLRETLEGMELEPQGDYTITNNYLAHQYGELGITPGTSPLRAPTSVGSYDLTPGSDYLKEVAHNNEAGGLFLDDGSSKNFFAAANTSIPLPYLDNPSRVGAALTFKTPVIFDERNNPNEWHFQPLSELTQANKATIQPATFSNTRPAKPADVGGSIKLAAFNVLNFFPHTGDSRMGCTYYKDRAGVPTTVDNSSAPGCGVRGAATAVSFDRQKAKIVKAINALDADIVSIEEMENSAKLGVSRDYGMNVLVNALNADAGGTIWKYVPSPSKLPALGDEDVIRTGFIYKRATVETVGESVILIGSAPFSSAREPDAQVFKPIYGDPDEEFIVISNHFKSRNNGGATGDNLDKGQGAYNADRTRQAQALMNFASDLETKFATDKVFIIGDFNSYAKEDPIKTILAAGYTSPTIATGKSSYAYESTVASLDYIFASPGASSLVTGADIWNINSYESVLHQYGHYNFNALNVFSAKSFYAASDHDPLLIGLDCLRHTPPIVVPSSDL